MDTDMNEIIRAAARGGHRLDARDERDDDGHDQDLGNNRPTPDPDQGQRTHTPHKPSMNELVRAAVDRDAHTELINKMHRGTW